MFDIKKFKRRLIGLAVASSLVWAVGCNKEKASDKYTDLKAYLNITDVGGYKGAAVVVDGVAEGVGFVEGDEFYLPYDVVRGSVDNNYYWDATEKVLSYATSKKVYDAKAGVSEYTEDGVAKSCGSNIVLCVDEKAYISLEYIELMNGAIDGETFDEPNRVLVNTKDSVEVVKAKSDAKLRTGSSNKDDIVADVSKGDKLTVIKDKGEKTFVYTEDGLMGYIEDSKVSGATSETVKKAQGWMETDKYEYISMDGKVCLGWHQMEAEGGNSSLSSVINGTDGLNVISPTWFKLIDSNGSISSLASSSYVDKAHNNGLQVWGLISDFNYDDEGNYYVNTVVKSTTARRKLIENIINEATECGMDGINVDFEMVRKVAAEGYVQFIRELAIACEKENLVLSVDMYVPTESNQYYDRESVGLVADYLIIMGYDEHWATCGSAGSVASLPYVTNGITDTLASVPAERVINAIPFYTRIWYQDSLENAPEGAIVIEDSINGDYALSSRAVGMGVAEKLLKENGATSRWLEDLGQNYGEFYTSEGRYGKVWLEDKESLTCKLDVMKANNLAGVACWKLGLESEEAWEAIGEFLK